MLAGDTTTGGDARLHDFPHRFVNAFALRRIVGAVGDVGMQVAVSGMKDIADHHVVFLADATDGRQNLRQLRPRDHRILNYEVWSEASHRAKGFLPALPQLHSLGVIAGDFDLSGPAFQTDSADSLEVSDNAGFESIELDQQNCFCVARIPRRVDGIFHYADGGPVHELERRGYNSRRDDRRSDMRSLIYGCEVGEKCPYRLRLWRKADSDIEGEPKTSLGPDESSAQVVAISLTNRVPQLHDFTARQNHGEGKDVIERHAVLEAVRSAGVLRHVAADGAGGLAGRIRRIQQSVWRDIAVETEIDDPRLDGGAAILDIERDDFLQAMQAKDDDIVTESAAG